jgi:hypothetical protein
MTVRAGQKRFEIKSKNNNKLDRFTLENICRLVYCLRKPTRVEHLEVVCVLLPLASVTWLKMFKW